MLLQATYRSQKTARRMHTTYTTLRPPSINSWFHTLGACRRAFTTSQCTAAGVQGLRHYHTQRKHKHTHFFLRPPASLENQRPENQPPAPNGRDPRKPSPISTGQKLGNHKKQTIISSPLSPSVPGTSERVAVAPVQTNKTIEKQKTIHRQQGRGGANKTGKKNTIHRQRGRGGGAGAR